MLELKINEALGVDEEELVSELIKISLMKRGSKNPNSLIYTEIYNLLGLDKFTELLSLVDGQTITLPTKKEFKDTIVTVLCYYYRNILNMEWKDIKEKLGLPDLNTISQGIKSSQFESSIKELIEKRLK